MEFIDSWPDLLNDYLTNTVLMFTDVTDFLRPAGVVAGFLFANR
jgi:hypothetical protein